MDDCAWFVDHPVTMALHQLVTTRASSAVLSLAVFSLCLFGACGETAPPTSSDCDPPCPDNELCEAGACVPGATVDMSMKVTGSDMAGCRAACQAPTPYCHRNGTCV